MNAIRENCAVDSELLLRIADLEKAAKLGELLLDRPASVDGAVDLELNRTWPCLVGIAMNQADQLGFGLTRAIAIDMKGDFIAGVNGNPVRVAEDLLLGHFYFLSDL